MSKTPSEKALREAFPELDQAGARMFRAVLAEGSLRDVADFAADFLEGTFGLGAMRDEEDDIVAHYIETGDIYNATVVYDSDRDTWYALTVGDWIERNDKEYKPRARYRGLRTV